MKKSIKILRFGLASLAFSILAISCSGRRQRMIHWIPQKPITIHISEESGEIGNLVTRMVVTLLGDRIDQDLVIVNQENPSELDPREDLISGAPDGYTWGAGKVTDFEALGDWALFLHTADVLVFSVNVETPFRSFGEFLGRHLDLSRDGSSGESEEITIATAGVTSSGFRELVSIAARTGLELDQRNFFGEPVSAVISGDADALLHPLGDQIEPLRRGKLRALALIADLPLELSGYGSIAPITEWLEEYSPTPERYGIWLPGDVPSEILATLGRWWSDHIVDSTDLTRFTREYGLLFDPVWGESAKAKFIPLLRQSVQYGSGTARGRLGDPILSPFCT